MKYSKIFRVSVIGSFLMLSIVVIQSCSTEKDAWINRGFHNMNAKYNGYFNAGEIIDQALISYRDKTKEDYTNILPVEAFPTKEESVGLATPMEDAIERCSKVIYKHAMPNPNIAKSKDEEYGKWIDNNWFVIGKGHYLKGEYPEAIEKFKYITKFYKGEDGIYLARLWLAKSYMAQGEYSKAKIELDKAKREKEEAEANEKSLMDYFKKDGKGKKKKKKMSKRKRKRMRKEKRKNKKNEPAKYTRKLKLEYEKTFAQYYIETEDYQKAIPHLEEAIDLTKSRKEKARYRFILAQVYQQMGNGGQAAYYFNKVAKSNAPYEMRFYAKINKALSSDANREELRKDLYKMIKDPKNEEYKDQIYYVLAEMDFKEGHIDQAKENYTHSVFYSVNNDRQKGISYLKLADIFFNEKDYIPAQKYYDSCVNVLPKDYEDYAKVKDKADGLSDLVVNYETVVLQDSLQKIALLPEKDREKFLKQTVKQIKEEEERKKREEEERLLAQQKRLNNSSANTGSGSKWYFYNQKAKGRGFNEFRSLYGQRVLEDDWRRSNKESFTETSENVDTSNVEKDEGLTVDDLRKNLPLTPEAIDSSTNLLMNALYNLGIIYKEQLKEVDEAAIYFQKILDRNVEHEKVLPATYQLYLIYTKKGKSSKANQYKNLILQNYPDSDIASFIKDPDYFKKKEEESKKELKAYEALLKKYGRRQYMDVITEASQVIKNQPKNQYINKYYLLKAFAISKSNVGGVDVIRQTLEELYKLSPNSEEGKQAKMYLDKISKGEQIVPLDNNNSAEKFKFNENEKHYFILVFPEDKGNINQTKTQISNFNQTFFRSANLKLQNSILDQQNQTLVVSPFANKDKANTYYKAFVSQPAKDKLGNTASEYDNFIISQSNYLLLLKNKNLEDYLKFFNENY